MTRCLSTVHCYRLDARGPARVLGQLEAEIMECLWLLEQGRVADVCAQLGSQANYKTVMTVMNRLVEKRLLQRSRVGRAFTYRPVESRDAFLGRVCLCVAEGLVRDFGDEAVARFVDAVDNVDPSLLCGLQDLLTERATGVAPDSVRPCGPAPIPKPSAEAPILTARPS